MKKLISVILTFSLLLSMFVGVGATTDSTTTPVEYMNEDVVVHLGTRDYSNANKENIKTHDITETAVNVANMVSNRGAENEKVVANAWIAFDLGKSKNISGIDMYLARTNVKEYSVYATNSDAIWSEVCDAEGNAVNYMKSLSKKDECIADTKNVDNTEGTTPGDDVILTVDGTIDRLIADGAAIAQNVATGYSDATKIDSTNVNAGKLSVDFNGQTKNARYVFIVIEDYVLAWYGIEFDYVSIYGPDADDTNDDTEGDGGSTDEPQNPALPDTSSYVDLMNANVGIKSHGGNSTTNEYMKVLDGPIEGSSDYYTTIGNLRTDNGVTNVWAAFDMGKANDVGQIKLYQPKRNIVDYRIYATNTASVYNNLVGGVSVPSSTITSLEEADALVASGSLIPYGSGNDFVSTQEDELDVITFADGTVKARYILIVVTSVHYIYYGAVLDYVGIYGIESDGTDEPIEPDEPQGPTLSTDFNTANPAYVDSFGNRYYPSASNLLANAMPETDFAVLTDGKNETGLSVSQGQSIVLDMSKETVINRVELTQNSNFIKKYSISYSLDGVSWKPFAECDITNTEYTTFEKGHPISHSNYSDAVICRYLKVDILSCEGAAMVLGVEAYNTETGAEVNFANGDVRRAVTGVKGSTNTLASMGKMEYILSPSRSNYDEHFIKTHTLSAVDSTFFAVDLGSVNSFDRIQIVSKENEPIKYRLYACNDDSMWSVIKSYDGSAKQITASEASRMELLASGTKASSQEDGRLASNPDYPNNRRYVHNFDFDEEIRARYLVYAIDETQYKYWSAGFLEFEVLKKPVDSLIHTPSADDPVFTPVGENYAQNKTVSFGKEYVGATVPFTDVDVLTDGVKSDGKNKFYLGGSTEEPIELVFDLGAPTPFDRAVIYEYGKQLKEFSIYSSFDGENWNKMGDYTNQPNDNRVPVYTEATFDFTVARYIKIEVKSIEELAILSEIEIYSSLEGTEITNELTADLITDEDLYFVSENLIDLPTSITDGTYSASITWACDDESVINTQTKEVTRGDADKNVILTATLSITGGSITQAQVIDMKFPVTVKADNVKDLVQTNAVSNTDFADGVYTYTHANDFLVKDNFVLELDVDTLGTDTVTVDLTEMQLTVAKNNADTVVKLGTEEILRAELPAHVKFKAEFIDGTLNFYVDKLNTYGYRLCLYGKEIENCTFNKITKSDAATVAVAATLSIPEHKVVNAVKEQLDFAKISNDEIFTVSNNLSLINEVFDVEISYATTDETAINGTTGAVDTDKYGVYTITATLAYGSDVQTREFYVAVGNKFSQKPVETSAVAVSGASTAAITETGNENAFVTQKNAYTITIDGQSETEISQIVLVEPDEWKGAITGFEIAVAGEDEKYTTVTTAGAINGEYIANFNPTKVRYIKISVTSTNGGRSGIAKAFAFYKPTDSGCAASDLAAITITNEISANFTMPKTGEYGSTYSYSSNNAAISVVAGESDYNMNVTTPENDISVDITVTATKNGASVSKTVRVRVLGNRETSSTFPDGGFNAGSTGGLGGGVGGGGGAPTTKPTVAEKTETEEPDKTPEEIYAEEIENHWAKTEISTLIEKGIVKGDGESLNLASSVTRAEFLTMIIRSGVFELKDYNGAFADVSADDWYAQYMQTGYDEGIISGDGTNANPNSPITRQEAAVMLSNLFDAVEIEESTFTDSDYISPWAKDGIAKAAVLGLIKGYEDGSFGPHRDIRRDEAMVVIYRYMMLTEEAK